MRELFGVPVGTLTVVLGVAVVLVLGLVGVLALRSRVFFKLGIRNMTRRRGRSVIIVVGLMLGTAIIASALGFGDIMTTTVRSSVLSTLGHTDESVSVRTAAASTVAPTVGTSSGARYLTGSEVTALVEAADAVPEVDAVTPAIVEQVAVQAPVSRQNEPQVTLFAADATAMDGFGEIRRTDGQVVELSDLTAEEVYANTAAADDLGAEEGDPVTLLGAGRQARLEIAGIVEYDGAGTDGAALIAPLATAQFLLNSSGVAQQVLVSNDGGMVAGADLTDRVVTALQPTVDRLGLQIEPVKQDGLERADDEGAVFVQMFTTMGTFTISAGILLIFLIFVMLAAERRSELGTARAVGTQRRHLVQMFMFEGLAYDILAAVVGAVLGLLLALGMVRIVAGALSTTGITIRYALRPSSMLLAFSLGVLLTFVVVVVSAWRVSRLNIVSAVRNLPEPRKQKRRRVWWLIAVVVIGLGGLMTAGGYSSKQASMFLVGVAVMLAGIVPVARALRLGKRVAYTTAGAAITVWSLLPFDVYEALLPGMQMDFSVWVLLGLVLVCGTTWVVVFNAPAILHAVMAVFGRSRYLAPVLKASIPQPLHNRFRTGATIGLFTLVVFTLVVGVGTSNSILTALDDEEEFGGGYQITAQTSPVSPIRDMGRALETAPGIDPDDITGYAGQSYLSVTARQAGTGDDFAAYPLRGLDRAFLQNTTYGFAAMADGYDSDREVWQALERTPGLAVIDPYVVPRRANWGFAAPTDFALSGFYLEDRHFDPVPVVVEDPQTGRRSRVTVIGVFKDTVPYAMIGISTSQQTVAGFGVRATPSVWYFSTAEGVDPVEEAARLESAFLANGMEATAQSEALDEAIASSFTFQWLVIGFLGMGLIIGVAALGVISARAVVERRQQIGVLRAIGFQGRMVRLGFLLESAFVTLIGIVLGTVLGVLTAYNVIADLAQEPSWENLSLSPPWVTVALILLAVFVTSLLTTLAPALRASRTYPAEALRYE